MFVPGNDHNPNRPSDDLAQVECVVSPFNLLFRLMPELSFINGHDTCVDASSPQAMLTEVPTK